MISKERLAELREMANEATEGPWKANRNGIANRIIHHESPHDAYVVAQNIAQCDATFIAIARTAIPELIAEVERLSGVLHRIGGLLSSDDLPSGSTLIAIADLVEDTNE